MYYDNDYNCCNTQCPCRPTPCCPTSEPCPEPTPTPNPGSNETALSEYANFYALTPSDNAAAIAAGAAVEFPQTAVTTAGIIRVSPTQFMLTKAGVYYVTFNASVSEAGQLQLELNGTPVAGSTTGRAAENSLIANGALLTVPANATLRVINPTGNTTAVTITSTAGGTQASAANLVIMKIA